MSKTATPNLGVLYWSQRNEFNKAIETAISRVRHLVEEQIPPWQFWLTVLTSIPNSINRFKIIQKKGRGNAGFIIGKWNEKGKLYGCLDHTNERLIEFTKQTTAYYPMIYYTLEAARNRASELDAHGHFGLTLWCSNGYVEAPLDLYTKIAAGKIRVRHKCSDD